GWALCNGQLLSIAQNSALFSILGTTYGGNGTTNFALPNLQGRFPMHWGQSPGLSNRVIGEQSGSESVTMLSSQMPTHTHIANATTLDGNTDQPTGAIWAHGVDASSNPLSNYSSGVTPNTTMNNQAIGAAGGNQPLGIMNPFLCVTFIIALN